MPDTDHIKHYSAADIQRYLEGKMLPAEMHALEMAALDDPFLADAIEGMQQPQAADKKAVEANLADLRQQLYDRVTPKDRRNAAPVIAFRWWQAAAAAAVVIIGAVVAYLSLNQLNSAESKDQLAITTQKKMPEANAVVTPQPAPSADASAAPADSTPLKFDANALTRGDSTKSAFIAGKQDSYGYSANLSQSSYSGDRYYRPLPKPSSDAAAKQEEGLVLANGAEGDLKVIEPPVTTLKKDAVATTELKKQEVANNLRITDTFDSTTNFSRVYEQRSKKNPLAANKPVDYEQIVIGKTTRDTSAAGYLTKPRELTMNQSRKELSARQAKKNPDALLSGYISGRVTDQSQNPISNALVRVDGRQDYFTDHKGYFKIPANDSVVNVAVGLSGYYTQNVQLSNNSFDNNIALNQLGNKAPNPLLNTRAANVSTEADNNVAYNFEAKQKALREANATQLAGDAQPEYGWIKYQQYLAQNVRIPANGAPGAGKVVVSFEVSKKGTLSNFKIEESLGTAYDDEAIRLIKAGPAWKLLKGRKAKTSVVVTF
ncbi:hypothetical protein [Paraflavitalea sp. CAU 1676]|uniref:hypothetical protein n=1 Tax=Paraflavitalea sp. CAU 1676 TaxID=3032598 RepID=UPI0023DC28F4|nr:hypothetical protein [Paraflavitalea sp. CAU 1676]MDF2191810.1 hypothetical protein [Paraflavitalea sp. CAU 1676]